MFLPVVVFLMFPCCHLATAQVSSAGRIVRIGHILTDATSGIDVPGTSFLLADSVLPDGVMFAFSTYFRSKSPMRIQVWRPQETSTPGANYYEFRLVWELPVTPEAAFSRQDIYFRPNASSSQSCYHFRQNDRVGVFIEDIPASVPYAFNQNSPSTLITSGTNNATARNIGDVVKFDTLQLPYDFSIVAYIDTVDGKFINDSREWVECPTAVIPTETPSTTTISAVPINQGDTGATGPIGPAGFNGTDGLPGATGPQGDTGLQGPQGLPGFNGTNGPKGEKGDIGPQGVQGAVGATGPQGPPGPAYFANNTAELVGPVAGASTKMGSTEIGLMIWLIILTIVVALVVIVVIFLLCRARQQEEQKHDETDGVKSRDSGNDGANVSAVSVKRNRLASKTTSGEQVAWSELKDESVVDYANTTLEKTPLHKSAGVFAYDGPFDHATDDENNAQINMPASTDAIY